MGALNIIPKVFVCWLLFNHLADAILTYDYVVPKGPCQSCSFRNNYWFYETDAAGVVTPLFSCNAAGAVELCERESGDAIQSYAPSLAEVCIASQPKITCYTTEPVTIWGDSKSDPSYTSSSVYANSAALIDGSVRDWDPDTFRMISTPDSGARNPQFVNWKNVENTDTVIHAHSGSSPLTSLMMLDGNVLSDTFPGYYTANNVFSSLIEGVPSYRNVNKKLLLYSSDNMAFITSALDGTTCNDKCAHTRMYQYLTTHNDVSMVKDAWFTNIYHHKFTAAEITTHLNTISAAGSTTCNNAKTCFNNIRWGTAASGYPHYMGCSKSVLNGAAAPLCTLTPSAVPTAADPDSFVALYTYIGRNLDNLTPYPFISMVYYSRNVQLTFGMTLYVEQSEDGVTWAPIRETVSANAYEFWQQGDYSNMHKSLTVDDDVPCSRAVTIASALSRCIIPVAVTGKNKYMRTVTVYPVGTNALWTGVTQNPRVLRIYPPMVAFTATKLEPVQVYVTPSLTTTATDVEIVKGCIAVENCNYIPNPETTYPADGVTLGGITGGSPTQRAFMKDVVLPAIHGCKKTLDPVIEFIRGRTVGNGCVRTSLTEETCYNYNPAASADSSMRYEIGANGDITYYNVKRGLTLSKRQWTPTFHIPAIAVGPVTKTTTTPAYYVYTSPVAAQYKHGKYYINAAEVCNTAGTPPTADNLPVSTSCTCSDVLIDVDKCLCLGTPAYKVVTPATAPTPMTMPGVTLPTGSLVLSSVDATFYKRTVPVMINAETACHRIVCGDADCAMSLADHYECKRKVEGVNSILQLLTEKEKSMGAALKMLADVNPAAAAIRSTMQMTFVEPVNMNYIRNQLMMDKCGSSNTPPKILHSATKAVIQKDSVHMDLQNQAAFAAFDMGAAYSGAVSMAIAKTSSHVNFCERGFDGLSTVAINAQNDLDRASAFMAQLTAALSRKYGYTFVEYFPTTDMYSFVNAHIDENSITIKYSPEICVGNAPYVPVGGHVFAGDNNGDWKITPSSIYSPMAITMSNIVMRSGVASCSPLSPTVTVSGVTTAAPTTVTTTTAAPGQSTTTVLGQTFSTTTTVAGNTATTSAAAGSSAASSAASTTTTTTSSPPGTQQLATDNVIGGVIVAVSLIGTVAAINMGITIYLFVTTQKLRSGTIYSLLQR